MYCRECGKEIDDDAAFCTYCGKSVVNIDISDHAVVSEDENKNAVLINRVKKVGIAVIIILLVIVLILTAGGTKNEVNEITELTTMEEGDKEESAMPEEAATTSALDDIIGDWAWNLTVWSDTYAHTYSERTSYLRVEAEGLKTIGSQPSTIYYAIGVDDITIEEIDGIKYYTYSAEMYSTYLRQQGLPGRQKIEIRLYMDEETGELICEYNVPEDGFWQKKGTFERISSIEEDMSRYYNGPINIP